MRFALFILITGTALSGAQAPDALARHSQAGATALAAKNWPEAEREYREALHLEPNIPELASNLGLALYYQRRYDAAAEMFERALRGEPQLFVPALFLGKMRIEQGQGAEAIPYLERCVRLQPQHALARRLLARGLVSAGAHERALDELRQVAVIEPNDVEVFYSLSKVSMHLARVWMETAANHPVEGPNYRRLVLARRSQPESESDFAPADDVEAMAASFRNRLRADPADAKAAYGLGRCYEFMTNRALRRMVELQPNSHRVHQLMAELAMEQGRTGEAIEHYERALVQKPGDGGLILGLGQAYRRDGQPEAAAAQLQKLLDRDPKDAAANFSLAQCYLALNDPQRAYASARRAVQADPKLLAAHGLTGRALAMQDRMAEAALELEKAAPVDRDGTLHYQMFLAYRKLQQPEKAQAALRKSNELRSRQRSEE